MSRLDPTTPATDEDVYSWRGGPIYADDQLHNHVWIAGNGGAQIAKLILRVERDADRIATLEHEDRRARAVLGPDCPKCGHYLKAEHRLYRNIGVPGGHDLICATCSESRAPGLLSCYSTSNREATLQNILTEWGHPAIAEELGLTTKETAT
jgi:hypothetical protein